MGRLPSVLPSYTETGIYGSAADDAFRTRVSGDSNDRHVVDADGKHHWGSGSAALDTNLYRSAANTLQTDDKLISADQISVRGTPIPSAMLSAVAGASTHMPIVARGAASQSADLQEWQDSAGTRLAEINAFGIMRTQGFVTLGGFYEWRSGAEQTTVGAAGAASALPANPEKYLQVRDSAGATLVIPAYLAS